MGCSVQRQRHGCPAEEVGGGQQDDAEREDDHAQKEQTEREVREPPVIRPCTEAAGRVPDPAADRRRTASHPGHAKPPRRRAAGTDPLLRPPEPSQYDFQLVEPHPAGTGRELGRDMGADVLFDLVRAEFRTPGQGGAGVGQVIVEPRGRLGRKPRGHVVNYVCHFRTSRQGCRCRRVRPTSG